MSEDGEKDQEKDEEAPSRPVTASARRKKRSSSRSSADDSATEDGTTEDGAAEQDTDSEAGTGGKAKRPAPKGKTSPAGRDKTEKSGSTAGKGRPTPRQDSKPKEQASLFARVRRFLREVWGELKKVVWPTRKQMVTYTAVVLVFLAFMIALVFGLDFVFNEAISVVFGN